MRPRLLFLSAYPAFTEGSRAISAEVADHLVSRGWTVILASRSGSRVMRVLDMLFTVCRKRRQYAVAHIDIYSADALIWAELTSRLLVWLRCPIVMTLHGGNLPLLFRVQPRRMRRLLARARLVTAPSAYLRDAARTCRDDVEVVPNGLHLDAYRHRRRETVAPRLVWVRAFHRIYRPSMAINVVARIAAQVPSVQLTMVGPDKDDSGDEARALARSLRVSHCVRFPGGQTKSAIPMFLDDADIFLNTSTIDNTPVTILEAAASGLCIVSTDVGGVPHLIQDGAEALLVPPDDVDVMASSVLRLLQDADLARRLSIGARARAERHDWASIIPRWEAIFATAVEPAADQRESIVG